MTQSRLLALQSALAVGGLVLGVLSLSNGEHVLAGLGAFLAVGYAVLAMQTHRRGR